MESKKNYGLNEHMTHNEKHAEKEKSETHSEAIKEAEKIRNELEEFKKKIVKKFPFVMSLSVLPSHSFKLFEEDEGLIKEEIEKKPLHLFMLIPEDEYKNIQKKIKPEIIKLIKEKNHNIWVHIKTPVDIWNYGLDSKFDFLDAVGTSYPLYDKGFLGALRVANIHKTLVLRKFEKYVATYAVGGSLVRGTAGKDSDVDTFVVIDDTDVKKMPRLQLLEKLRGFIQEYIHEASVLAGVKNILNVQVYLLTDFWQSVKDANPVIFTFIRDGIPMHDRGTFLPWKLLLKMGKIKPSPEAVDNFMKYGEQNDSLVKRRLIDAMIDIYWGVVTPTQALIMLAGEGPESPKNLVEQVKRLFVDKEKIMAQNELKILEKTVKLYKDYEHGKLKSISGAELDKLLEESKDYDKKLKELRKKLEERIIEHTANKIYEEIFGMLKNILGDASKEELIKMFDKELVKTGKIPSRYSQIIHIASNIKSKAKTGKLTQGEIDSIRRDSEDLINKLVEYVQRKEMIKFEENVFDINYGDKKAELVLTSDKSFLVIDGKIKKIGTHSIVESNSQEFEDAMKNSHKSKKIAISSNILDILKKELGEFSICSNL